MSSEESILTDIHGSIRMRNLQALSMKIEELRSKSLLTDANKAKIEGWIEENFPISMVPIGKSLLESDDEEDEKELEEKIPPLHPKNICSSDTQTNLTGNKMSPEMEQVVTFLLPKSKKSECVTERDLLKIVGKREDEIYLFEPSKKELLTSVIVYRLPTSGIWIVGYPMYFRIFRAYQLESFGKHTISVETHRVGSVWRQEHELFLAKPLHWNDFVAFIRDNTSFPIVPSACACMFKTEESDWSATAKNSLPVNECRWMIPTWNGIPIFLGDNCGLLSGWASKKLIIPDIKKEIGTLTAIQTSMFAINNIIQSLYEAAYNNNLYIKTDRSERVRVSNFLYAFIWTDPPLRVEDTEYIGEISARLGKWPAHLGIEIKIESKLKGAPIALVTKESLLLLDIGRVNIFPETEEIKFDWTLNITENLPEVPISPLSLQKVKDFPNFVSSVRAKIARRESKLVQGANESMVSRLSSANFLYADGNDPDLLSRVKLMDLPSEIEKLIKEHGPPIRLSIELKLDNNLPESDDPAKVVSTRDESILLPSTDNTNGFDKIMTLTYVVNLS